MCMRDACCHVEFVQRLLCIWLCGMSMGVYVVIHMDRNVGKSCNDLSTCAIIAHNILLLACFAIVNTCSLLDTVSVSLLHGIVYIIINMHHQ